MQNIQTFRADSMHEALGLVRRELGPDALILHTRQVPIKSRLPWQKDKVVTEILAVPEEQPELVLSAAAQTKKTERPQRAATTNTTPAAKLDRRPSHSVPADSQREMPVNQRESTPEPITNRIEPVRESDRLQQLMNDRLEALQQMVEQLSRQMQSTSTPAIPAELVDIYTQLVDAEVDETYVRHLISNLAGQSTAAERQQPALMRQRLVSLLTECIRCKGPIRVQPGRQKIVALVGPTGVGKTTTLAKLAVNFRLRDQMRLGLITVDTYRIAAVDQLRTYAEILELPMKVVTTSAEMQRAVHELADQDLILIDTAGRSPQDELRITELQEFLSQILVDEVQLVLSATTGLKQQKQIIERFRAVQPTSCILTKLDETPGAGAIVNIAGQLGLPLSYLTTGQNVPKDIEPAERSRAVRLVLGQEQIVSTHNEKGSPL